MARKRGRKPGLRPDGPKIQQIRIGLGLEPSDVARRMGPRRNAAALLYVERDSSLLYIS